MGQKVYKPFPNVGEGGLVIGEMKYGGVHHQGMDHGGMDHGGMDHGSCSMNVSRWRIK